MFPKGFHSFGRNIGIKNDSLDFAVIYSETPCKAAAVFTQNNFPGAPIVVGREHIKKGILQAIVINSKNANVATGKKGVEDAYQMCEGIGKSLGIPPESVLPSSTGVIGYPLPMEKIYPACLDAKKYLKPSNLEEVAKAIMTTDTKEKIHFVKRTLGSTEGVTYGIAKGAGMIEPNMATMLCYILSDFEPESGDVKGLLKQAVDSSFNCMTIDSDTSTSDTVVLMCSGKAGKLADSLFYQDLLEICVELTKKVARDGEGATKLIELKVTNGKTPEQVRKIGKSILNSPLVKTAIYGGDPNWGRLVMAIGKVFDEPIPFEGLQIQFGNLQVKEATPETRKKLSEYLKSNETINMEVNLGVGKEEKVFWSCDFTEGYIKENAYYTT